MVAQDVRPACVDGRDKLVASPLGGTASLPAGFDAVYDEPMSMWRKAVDILVSGATDVVVGVDRGDPSLIRKGTRRIQTARDAMSSSEFLARGIRC